MADFDRLGAVVGWTGLVDARFTAPEIGRRADDVDWLFATDPHADRNSVRVGPKDRGVALGKFLRPAQHCARLRQIRFALSAPYHLPDSRSVLDRGRQRRIADSAEEDFAIVLRPEIDCVLLLTKQRQAEIGKKTPAGVDILDAIDHAIDAGDAHHTSLPEIRFSVPTWPLASYRCRDWRKRRLRSEAPETRTRSLRPASNMDKDR